MDEESASISQSPRPRRQSLVFYRLCRFWNPLLKHQPAWNPFAQWSQRTKVHLGAVTSHIFHQGTIEFSSDRPAPKMLLASRAASGSLGGKASSRSSGGPVPAFLGAAVS